MKSAVIILFCTISGVSFGGIAAIMMAPSIAAFYAGGLLGGATGLFCSPLFLLKRNHPNIFPVMVLGFVLSFPIAVLCGMAWNPRLGFVLPTVTILTVVYFGLIARVADTGNDLFTRKDIVIVPLICLIIAGILTYSYDPLPDDIPSLIRMMGDNDIQIRYEAARKLGKHGKSPFLKGPSGFGLSS